MATMQSICVFSGSNFGVRESYARSAEALGRDIARRGWRLVYGGSQVGLMGVVADAALGQGGEVVGVIPEALMNKELGHHGLSELHVVASMHERKQMMSELSDGVVALPGGMGTLEELCEMLTWAQLGFHTKACGILNVDGYYDQLMAFFDHALKEEYVRPEHRGILLSDSQPAALLDAMRVYTPPAVEKWITRESS